MITETTTTTTDASAEDRQSVQGIEDDNRGGSGLTTGPVNWQLQQSVHFSFFQVANSNNVSSLSSCCLIFFIRFHFFCLLHKITINNAILQKIVLYQVYTNLAYVTPT